jgi:hypothetical protein
MEQAIWFFSGVICFKLIAKLIEYKQLVDFSAQVGLQILLVSVNILHDISFMQEIKYKNLKENGTSDADLQLIKEIDEHILANWKNSVIVKFKSSIPPSVARVFDFDDWDGAIRTLDKYVKGKRRAGA